MYLLPIYLLTGAIMCLLRSALSKCDTVHMGRYLPYGPSRVLSSGCRTYYFRDLTRDPNSANYPYMYGQQLMLWGHTDRNTDTHTHAYTDVVMATSSGVGGFWSKLFLKVPSQLALYCPGLRVSNRWLKVRMGRK